VAGGGNGEGNGVSASTGAAGGRGNEMGDAAGGDECGKLHFEIGGKLAIQ
jgi:hypothetical protein